jgi:hypothetical protein
MPTALKSFLIMGILTLGLSPDYAFAQSTTVVSLVVQIKAHPKTETMTVSTEIDLVGAAPGTYQAVFTQPTKVFKFSDRATGQAIAYRFLPIPGVGEQTGYKFIEFDLTSAATNQTVVIEYEYDRKTFAGYAPNPSTNDNLHLGQITKDAIYSSHLYYYPEMFDGSQKAKIILDVPKGWRAVSSGELNSETQIANDRVQFVYDADFPSGRLPYSIAMAEYQELKFNYAGRLPISVFFAMSDAQFAQEKVAAIESKILPFLENLMGDFPFPSLKIIEVFPWEGNTGLAARGIVMLSQKIWFAGDLGKDLSKLPASVLVDEIAHNWNFYGTQLPNFLAEGVSQFTDAMFVEHMQGKAAYDNEIQRMRDGFMQTASMLNTLKDLHGKGLTLEQAATELKMEPAQLAPYWVHAPVGELPIADPNVFPALYFLKGALAIDALRKEIGEQFFLEGMKAIFSSKTEHLWTLEEFITVFAQKSGKDLNAFCHRWYFQKGL